MGCSNSSSAEGSGGTSKEMGEESVSEDDKRRNYGGVYVGIPVDAASALCSKSNDGQKESCTSYSERKEANSSQTMHVC